MGAARRAQEQRGVEVRLQRESWTFMSDAAAS